MEETKEYSIETDPLFQELSSDKKQVIDEAVERKIRSLTLDENVNTDETKIPGQNYALISLVSPSSNQKSEHLCLKIKGVFDKLDDARKQAEILQKLDSTFDIYVVEMYSWLLVPPDPELLEQVHIDNKLNEIIAGHRENQLKSKMYFQERKQELMDDVTIKNKEQQEKNKLEKEKELLQLEEVPSLEEVPPLEENNTVPNGVMTNDTGVPNGNNCPNSVETSTPSELMNEMVNKNESWADQMEEVD